MHGQWTQDTHAPARMNAWRTARRPSKASARAGKRIWRPAPAGRAHAELQRHERMQVQVQVRAAPRAVQCSALLISAQLSVSPGGWSYQQESPGR